MSAVSCPLPSTGLLSHRLSVYLLLFSGIVQDVVLIGAPVSSSTADWAQMRRVRLLLLLYWGAAA
jgi:hypothetical protein